MANDIGIDVDTAKEWMSILELSGIVFLLKPYASDVLEHAAQGPKLYFRDTGLACYLTRWLTPDTVAFGAMSQKIFKSFAISEILKSYANHGIDYRDCVSYYQGFDGEAANQSTESVKHRGEIDLIIEQKNTLYPIDILANAYYLRSESKTGIFNVLNKVPGKDVGTGAVICLDLEPGVFSENAMKLPIWNI